MEKCIPHNSLEMEKKTSSISYNAKKCDQLYFFPPKCMTQLRTINKHLAFNENDIKNLPFESKGVTTFETPHLSLNV